MQWNLNVPENRLNKELVDVNELFKSLTVYDENNGFSSASLMEKL